MKETKNIKTKRLIIRKFLASDWADLWEYLSDERVVKFEPYEPINQQQSKEIALNHSKSDEFWAVCLEGKVIGNIYLEEVVEGSWEIGFVFHYDYQHQGFAYEAAMVMIDQIFAQGAHRIFAECHPENRASWKLLENLGFIKRSSFKKKYLFQKNNKRVPYMARYLGLRIISRR